MKLWIDFELAVEVRNILFMEGKMWAIGALYDALAEGPIALEGSDCTAVVLALEKIDPEVWENKGKIPVDL